MQADPLPSEPLGRNHKLVGWSFGFYSNSDDVDESGSIATRTVNDMDLVEVSILDDTKSPAYYGTSVETRSEDGAVIEIRENIEDETVDIEQLAELVADKVIAKLATTTKVRVVLLSFYNWTSQQSVSSHPVEKSPKEFLLYNEMFISCYLV